MKTTKTTKATKTTGTNGDDETLIIFYDRDYAKSGTRSTRTSNQAKLPIPSVNEHANQNGNVNVNEIELSFPG